MQSYEIPMICFALVYVVKNMLELTVSLTSLSHPFSFTTFSRSSYSTHSLFIPSPTHSPHFLVPFTRHILSSLSSSFSHPTYTLSSSRLNHTIRLLLLTSLSQLFSFNTFTRPFLYSLPCSLS